MNETSAISAAGAAIVVGKPIADKVAELTGYLLGPVAKEMGCGLGEVGKRFKLKNQAATIEFLESIADECGITLSSLDVDPAFAVEWLESVSNVSDSDLQQLWARLMATASIGDAKDYQRYMFVLKQMVPSDAQLLTHCISYSKSIRCPSKDEFSNIDESVATLFRLGLLTHSFVKCGETVSDASYPDGSLSSDDIQVWVSQFGKRFADAVGIRNSIDES